MMAATTTTTNTDVSLVPSQAITGRTNGRNNANTSRIALPPPSVNSATTSSRTGEAPDAADRGPNVNGGGDAQRNKRRARKKKTANNPPNLTTATSGDDSPSDAVQQQQQQQQPKEQRRNKRTPRAEQPKQQQPPKNKSRGRRGNNTSNNNSNSKKHAWWRNQLPPDAVDPITLDPLDQLPYPPFALVATEPYEPIDWPPNDVSKNSSSNTSDDDHHHHKKDAASEEERQRKILHAQWGKQLSGDEADEDAKQEATTTNAETERRANKNHRHVNLFDGRALAYYMVSQLQFIDPLNRRDLVRDELVHLDRYLRRHFHDNDNNNNNVCAAHTTTDANVFSNVTEAYDAKGVTISTAGSAATTATGRASILQQEARVLLHALFGNHPQHATNTASASATAATGTASSSNNNNNSSNSLMQQYQAHEASQQRQSRRRQNNNGNNSSAEEQEQDIGIYGEHGFVIIDDDENPGLRGNAPPFVPGGAINTMYSASHITNRYLGHAARAQEHEFPALSATTTATATLDTTTAAPEEAPKKTLPKTKTLTKIAKLVQKTNPEEQQRQWEAREEALRKAMLSNLTFGSNQAVCGGSMEQQPSVDRVPSTQIITTTTSAAPTEAQLERNRAFAEALGVKPATVRTNVLAGWTRPSEAIVQFDEFGNELNATAYPETLIRQASEMRLDVLLKLEKKWTSFLADDTAASLSLNPMEHSLRALVHEYSDYWKLQTESFDPEPKRYVHCVKLRDTSAPYPLLSDASRNWRPGRMVLLASSFSDRPSTTTASVLQRELPPGPARVPLSLKPRSVVVGTASGGGPPGVSIGGAPSRSMLEPDDGTNSRFSSLADGRERTKLELQKRTLPLELPPFDAPLKGLDVAEDLERQRERNAAKARKGQEDAERKQRAIAAAFDSDDERESRHHHHRKSNDDSESEWEEQEAVYAGTDDE